MDKSQLSNLLIAVFAQSLHDIYAQKGGEYTTRDTIDKYLEPFEITVNNLFNLLRTDAMERVTGIRYNQEDVECLSLSMILCFHSLGMIHHLEELQGKEGIQQQGGVEGSTQLDVDKLIRDIFNMG